jgi:aldose 1-epimerase
VRLEAGQLSLELLPALGGAIGAFQLRRAGQTFDLMRRTQPALVSEVGVLATASFPLVPFSNRIENGVFHFRGQEIRMVPNMPPHPHPLHGHGWRASWDVSRRTPDSAELVYRHNGGDWPWAYRAVQRFRLAGSALEVSMSLTNESSDAMPAGMGLHPYFDRTPHASMVTAAPRVWLSENAIPRSLVEVPSHWDFSRDLRISELDLDHCFSGWSRQADIVWPERRLRLRIDADPVLSHLVVYVPPGQDYFCVEPVSNANDAFNLADRGTEDTGMVVLAPQSTLSATARFAVETL